MKTRKRQIKSRPKRSLTQLGRRVTSFKGIETFPAPPNTRKVICTSDEMTAVCPVTGQPDWYVIRIVYIPNKLCVESKTLKLYIQSFRQHGQFVENLADTIAQRLFKELAPWGIKVTMTQKARGGVSIQSTAVLGDMTYWVGMEDYCE